MAGLLYTFSSLSRMCRASSYTKDARRWKLFIGSSSRVVWVLSSSMAHFAVSLWRATCSFGNSLGCLDISHRTPLDSNLIRCNPTSVLLLEASFGGKRCPAMALSLHYLEISFRLYSYMYSTILGDDITSQMPLNLICFSPYSLPHPPLHSPSTLHPQF